MYAESLVPRYDQPHPSFRRRVLTAVLAGDGRARIPACSGNAANQASMSRNDLAANDGRINA